MADVVLNERLDLYLKRLDTEGGKIAIPLGTTPFGRGPFLKCKEKKVSRNHGLLELTPDGRVLITSSHSSPVYVRSVGETDAKPLRKDEPQLLKVGDEFRLLQDSFCYQLCAANATTSGQNGQRASALDRSGQEIRSSGGDASGPAPSGGRGPAVSGSDYLFGDDFSDAVSAENRTGTAGTAETTSAVGASDDKSGLHAATGQPATAERPADEAAGRSSSITDTYRTESAAAAAEVASTPRTQTPGAGAEPRTPTAGPPGTEAGRRTPQSKLSNGAAQSTPLMNGSVRKRKLPAFLLDLDSAPGGSSDTPKKRTPAPAGRGRGGAGRGRQRAAPAAGSSPRGRGRQRPSQREQMSQHSDDELPPPLPPTPPQATVKVAATPAVVVTSPSEATHVVTGTAGASAASKPASPPLASAGSAASVTANSAATAPPITVTSPGRSPAVDTGAPTGPAPGVSSPRVPQVAAQGGSHAVSDDSDEEAAAAAAASSSQRESCAYGANCFRTNPAHRLQFAHPEDADYTAPAPPPPAGQPLPECEFGVNCYRRNPLHRRQFAHSSRPNPRREAKRKGRQKAQKAAAGDTPDSYDLDDPFINDSESDDYAPEDSGSDWSAEEGSGSDEEDRRRREREARRLTGRR